MCHSRNYIIFKSYKFLRFEMIVYFGKKSIKRGVQRWRDRLDWQMRSPYKNQLTNRKRQILQSFADSRFPPVRQIFAEVYIRRCSWIIRTLALDMYWKAAQSCALCCAGRHCTSSTAIIAYFGHTSPMDVGWAHPRIGLGCTQLWNLRYLCS